MRDPVRFIVCLPTFNRAGTLTRAIESLFAQTYQSWRCVVIDDGSTDGTRELVLDLLTTGDTRILYQRHTPNQGGVHANRVGMELACNDADYDAWVRLGSDDWFGPRKLELDARALKDHEACWGCYDAAPHPPPNRHGVSCTAAKAKNDLLMCTMRASWANVAVRTDVLRKVRSQFGFDVPGSRNMEDTVLNARIACVADWRWRGIVNGEYCDRDEDGLITEIFEAAWSDVPGGCTGNQEQCSIDINASARVIAALRSEHRG